MLIASLATYRPRIKGIVWDAVESLSHQCDEVYVNVNTHPSISMSDLIYLQDSAARWKNVILNIITEDNGDLSKFEQLISHPSESDDVFLICDDDLIYPSDYAERCKTLLDEIQCPISFGGKQLKNPPYKNFRGSFKTWTQAFTGSYKTHEIHLPLTAVTSLKRNMLKEELEIDREYKNKGDVLFAKWVKQSKTKLVCPEFEEGYFKYNDKMEGEETIWNEMKANPKIEKHLASLLTELYNI